MNKARQTRLGPLSVIIVFLVLSAGIRMTGAVGVAFAAAQTTVSDEPTEVENDKQDPDLDALLKSFKSREEAVEKDEERISRRSDELKSLEAEIEEKIKELQQSEARLRELLAIADVAAEDDVTRLTSVYESMKPKAAAIVFEQMPPAFAAGFLSRMQPASAALVMASLTPESAYAISVVFAGRNAEKGTK